MIGRVLKPFKDSDLIEELDTNNRMELVKAMTRNHPTDVLGFQHIFKDTKDDTLPSDIYVKLKNRKNLPTVFICYTNSKNKITQVFSGYNLKQITSCLKTAKSKGLVDTNIHLEGEDDDILV